MGKAASDGRAFTVIASIGAIAMGARSGHAGKGQAGAPPGSVSTGPGDTAALDQELARLPASVRSALEKAEIRFVAVKDSVVEHMNELRGVKVAGHRGATWDQVPGAFDYASRTVIVATSGKYPHGSFNLALHEIGHAYEFARGGLSDSAAFAAAYSADAKSFGDYYLQSGAGGRREAFAESFARHFGGDVSMARSWSNLDRYWRAGP